MVDTWKLVDTIRPWEFEWDPEPGDLVLVPVIKRGKPVKRIRYGDEAFWKKFPHIKPPAKCNCGSRKGECHARGCEHEACPVCGTQLVACRCEHKEV